MPPAPAPSAPTDLSSTLEGIRAAIAAEGAGNGLAGKLQAAILRLLEVLVALLADFRAGRLSGLAVESGAADAAPGPRAVAPDRSSAPARGWWEACARAGVKLLGWGAAASWEDAPADGAAVRPAPEDAEMRGRERSIAAAGGATAAFRCRNDKCRPARAPGPETLSPRRGCTAPRPAFRRAVAGYARLRGLTHPTTRSFTAENAGGRDRFHTVSKAGFGGCRIRAFTSLRYSNEIA